MAEATEVTVPLPREMRVEEVAVRLGCSRMTVQRRVRAGLLTPIGNGKELRFSAEEVERYARGERNVTK